MKGGAAIADDLCHKNFTNPISAFYFRLNRCTYMKIPRYGEREFASHPTVSGQQNHESVVQTFTIALAYPPIRLSSRLAHNFRPLVACLRTASVCKKRQHTSSSTRAAHANGTWSIYDRDHELSSDVEQERTSLCFSGAYIYPCYQPLSDDGNDGLEAWPPFSISLCSRLSAHRRRRLGCGYRPWNRSVRRRPK